MKTTNSVLQKSIFGVFWLVLSWYSPNSAGGEANQLAPDQAEFFEKNIRPVLTEKCYKCHSATSEKIKGGLTLDTREGIRRGGDNGPAVVPANLEHSILIQAIHYTNPDFSMPPKSMGGKLPDSVIANFETWVKMGAPDPRDGLAKEVKKYDPSKAKEWWAFQNPKSESPPTVKDRSWVKNDIDQFILAGLEAKSLKPVVDADKLTLIRRVYYDLIGLPPSPEEVDAFIKDRSAQAYVKVVDGLLASPRFGERWGRHWLDVARFAESTGKDINIAYPYAWRYRDYVLASFQSDKPFDQFLREQIAGDLLPAKDDRQKADQLIATGFLCIGTKSLNEKDPKQFALDVADEQIDAMSQAMLGMTLACARCHDHKFDPVTQREYYALAGIFLSTDAKFGTANGLQNRHATNLVALPSGAGLPTPNKTLSASERVSLEKKLEELKEDRKELFAEMIQERQTGKGVEKKSPKQDKNSSASTAQKTQKNKKDKKVLLLEVAQIGQIETTLKSYDENGKLKALTMAVQDLPVSSQRGFGRRGEGGQGAMRKFFEDGIAPRAPEFSSIDNCALYARGDKDKPGEKVPRGVVNILSQDTRVTISANESGRKELADWITSPQNPLTARVMVNRIWHWIFGRGIVPTTDNFGNSGQKPDNQPLLDSLAVQFMKKGWSVKQMIREIVLSHTYQLSSNYDATNFLVDPENALVWRVSKRRLDAECLHDAMLQASGQLILTPPLGSAIAMAGDGPIGGKRDRRGAESQITAETYTRAVYQAIARDDLPDSLAVFDFADPGFVTGSREVTNVPSQALYILNSPFVGRLASSLADRLATQFPAHVANPSVMTNFEPRVNYAYQLLFSRPPTPAERVAASNFFLRFPSSWKKGEKNSAGMLDAEDVKAAWTSFCRALFASAEFRSLN